MNITEMSDILTNSTYKAKCLDELERLAKKDLNNQQFLLVWSKHELMVSLRCTCLRQRVDRRMLMKVYAALFPNIIQMKKVSKNFNFNFSLLGGSGQKSRLSVGLFDVISNAMPAA